MKQELNLHEGWKLRHFEPGQGEEQGAFLPDYLDEKWLPAAVPGDVHLDMERAGLIPNPFYADNAEKCRWMEEKEWWYRLRFTVPPEMRGRPAKLVFEGLDCFATIWLNGERLGGHRDMFVGCEFDVTGRLREMNTLAVRLDSPLKAVADKDVTELVASHKERLYARKCQMSYGWDFAPRLVTVGIWRPVRLVFADRVSIEDLFVQTAIEGRRRAKVEVEIALVSYMAKRTKVELRLSLTPVNFTGRALSWPLQVEIEPGETKVVRERLLLEGAKLWDPHTVGYPHLYLLQVEALIRDEMRDECAVRFGIRQVELVRSADDPSDPHRFLFRINGRAVFAKGANWIVPDAIPARVSEKKYRRLLTMAKEANMNMLRVWGGGIPETQTFYNLCDELGIMVWQDFPYTCADYPEDAEFLSLAEYEAEKIVKKRRNHPSLVVWCGSNETLWLNRYGHRILYETLPRVCRRLDPTRPYIVSSPHGGYYPNDSHEGDRHNWDVWHGKQPYQAYAQDEARFISEFGLQATPVLVTLREAIPPEQLTDEAVCRQVVSSEEESAWSYHNAQFDKLVLYAAEFGEIEGVESLVRYSQMAQATAVKYAIEHFRRRKYRCGGCLFWQLNDVWPSISWSAIDYCLRPKMLYYYARKAYAPLLASFKEEGGRVSLWLTSDRQRKTVARLEVRCQTFTGQVLWREEREVEVPADASLKVMDIPLEDITLLDQAEGHLWVRVMTADGEVVENAHFLAEPRELRWPEATLAATWRKEGQSWMVTIGTDNYARVVTLTGLNEEGVYVSDNYFDLPAGGKREVVVRFGETEGKASLGLRIQAWNSSPFTIILGEGR